MANPNILSKRYATEQINEIYSEKGKIRAERDLWIAVMKTQKELGVNIPSKEIEKFEIARDNINLELIKEIELKTKHEIKAKIEAFVKAAGANEYIHLAMTARDLSDNVEQMQIKQAAKIIFGKYVSIVRHLMDKTKEYENIVLTARTHHQPAQPTLLGRRFSMWTEELMENLENLEAFIKDYPLRGIKGPIGTQTDILNLLGGNETKVDALEKRIAKKLGFERTLSSPGQIYPRSLDLKLISTLSLLAATCENFAKGIRLMAGYELVTEGFKEGQTGSSAMPHKMNTRSSERICGFSELLKMYLDGASRISGDQWEEGDVSCSVIRRVILPDAFYTSDGICETTLTILNNMDHYPKTIDKETGKYLPFLATTEILTTAVESGIGREKAHELIKKHSIAEALKMKQGEEKNKLAESLAKEDEFTKADITKEKIESIISGKRTSIGLARKQISNIAERVHSLIKRYPTEAAYEPKEIL